LSELYRKLLGLLSKRLKSN